MQDAYTKTNTRSYHKICVFFVHYMRKHADHGRQVLE